MIDILFDGWQSAADAMGEEEIDKPFFEDDDFYDDDEDYN